MTSASIKVSVSDAAGTVVHIGSQTLEVSVDTAKDIVDTARQVVRTGKPVTYTITGDLCDVVFLIGPSTPLIVEFAPGTAPDAPTRGKTW